MKYLLFTLFMLIGLAVNASYSVVTEQKAETQTVVSSSESVVSPFSFLKNKTNRLAFWITFFVAAIGVYTLYGIPAGIIAVAVTYFATNGNKKAFKLSIWGCIAGMIVGALIKLAVLFI